MLYLTLTVLAVFLIIAAIVFYYGNMIFKSLVRTIDTLRSGKMPFIRRNDIPIVKNLSDAITTTFKDNICLIDKLTTEVKELDVQIKLLARQKNGIESVISSIHDAVIVSDSYGRLNMANNAAAKLFGFDLEECKLQSLKEITNSSASKLVDLLQQSQQSKIPHVKREIIMDYQDKEHTFECLVSCIFSHDKEVSGVVAVVHDVTREKEISQMKNEFVSHVSHELKTPLASINAYAEMLADGEAQDEKTMKEFCNVIQSQAKRLNSLIEDILNISRIESGLVKVSKESLSLGVLIRDSVEMIKSYAGEKDITVIEKSDIVCDQVMADKGMMNQVIVNLLSNAVKYTPNGGKVSIGAEVNDADNIVRVTVIDTGVGIPEDEVEKVFNKFYRVSANNKCAKGTGLGLNLVKKIVEDVHDGKIFVTSKVGQGSRFSFDIPLSNNLEKVTA